MKGVAAAADVLSPPDTGITMLIYHRVGAGSGSQMDLSPAVFDQQLAWLAATQRLVTLDQALEELEANTHAAKSRPALVLTFDDGTTDWVDNVLPALELHSVPATFYVATSFVDEGIPFPSNGRPLSWAGVEELASSDLATIGSHTHRHSLLDRLDPARVAEELDRSIDLLGSRAGVEAKHFAYPKAVLGSPAAEQAVRERFRSAVLAGTRANPVGTDPYRLRRSPVQACDGQRWFRRKAVGGLGIEDDLRGLANRARYRNRSS